LKGAIRENVGRSSRIMIDEWAAYQKRAFAGRPVLRARREALLPL
jgi:hypothetical protein